MITQHVLEKCITRLSLLPFFPGDDKARIAISDLIEEFAETDEQVDWLGKRMLALYSKWDSPRELRACFCSRYKPKDGISVYSEVYADGIPSEKQQERKQLTGPKVLLLPGGRKHEEIQDPASAAVITGLKDALPQMPSGAPLRTASEELFREAITAPRDREELPGPTPQVITPEEIERAVAANRERKARGVAEFWKEEPDGSDGTTVAGG